MMSDPVEASLKRLVKRACDGLKGSKEDDLRTRSALVVQTVGKSLRLVRGELPLWGDAARLVPKGYLDDETLEVLRNIQKDQRFHAYDGRLLWQLALGFDMRATDVPVTFLSDYFETLGSLRFKEPHFRNRFSEMLRFFDTDKPFRLKIVAPLWGFVAIPRRVTLDDAQVRKIDLASVARLVNEDMNVLMTFSEQEPFEYVLEFAFDMPKITTSGDPQEARESGGNWDSIYQIATRINQELALLRCFTNQVPRAVTFGHYYEGWPASFFKGGPRIELPWRNSISSPAPALTSPEIRSFRKQRERFLAIPADSRQLLSAAARRIAVAEDAAYAGDQVVDFVSAIEGLLLSDVNVEAKYRFKERVAFLLGSRPKRLGLAKKAADLYDLRSAVVHGRVVPDQSGFGVVFLEGLQARKKGRHGSVEIAAREARQMAKDCLQKITVLGGQVPDWDEVILG